MPLKFINVKKLHLVDSKTERVALRMIAEHRDDGLNELESLERHEIIQFNVDVFVFF